MARRGTENPTASTEKPTRTSRSSPAKVKSAGAEAEEDVILAPSLANVVGYLLRRSHNAFQSYWMASFRGSATPITPVQGGMLVVLSENPGLTQTALARMMRVEGPTLMQSIDRLEQQGYLQRLRRVGDRRSYSLQLTERGQEVLAAIEAFLPEREAALMTDLTPEEIQVLSGLLTKIVVRAHQRLRDLQNNADADAEAPATAHRTGRGG